MVAEEIKKEVDELLKCIRAIKVAYVCQNNSIFNENVPEEFERKCKDFKIVNEYNSFYTRGLKLIKVVAPERLADFEQVYKNKQRKNDFDLDTYDISLGLTGVYKAINKKAFFDHMYRLFEQQEGIICGVLGVLYSKLFDIHGEIQYGIFMQELDAAEHLLKNHFVRAAGAVAGVALEAHIKSVCLNHNLKITKKDDLSKYNDNLKNNSIINQITWRKIQFLTDIRNACDHKRDEEPTTEQVKALIDWTKKIISEVI